jgi:hypothetical protein
MQQRSFFEPIPPEPTSFHVRQPITAAEQEAGEVKAKSQETQVLEFFQARPGEHVTPFDVWRAVGKPKDWPLTSVRRAMTNLTGRGLLVFHAADLRPGDLGATNHTWSLAQ